MAVTIKAIFLGNNGSMNFIKGEIYTLTIHENRIVSPRHVPYGSTEAFLRNWLPLAEREREVAATGDGIVAWKPGEFITINEAKEIENG